MNLFRRGMRAPRDMMVQPEAARIVKDVGREQVVALPHLTEQAERNINRKLEKIMHTLDDLLAAVAGQRTQIDSLVTLANSLHQQVIEAMGSTLTPSQQDRIDRTFAAINDNADAVTAAIKANTVEATAGAISGGQSMAAIKGSLNPNLNADQLQQQQAEIDAKRE